MINKLIIDTLKPLEIPVSFGRYIGNATEYVMFNTGNVRADFYADNVEEIEKYEIDIAYWRKNSGINTIKTIKKLMKEKEFIYLGKKDLFHNNFYGTVLMFRYIEFTEEGAEDE